MGFDLDIEARGTVYREIGTDRGSSCDEAKALETFDLVYRTLCAVMFNFSGSGHPGGSISSGRIVSSLLFRSMAYDISEPDRPDADIISYAAGHKALGLYAMWACRNEVMRLARPDLLPRERQQLRLEDMLGFRRNPMTKTPLFVEHSAKPLDGHPTPATPFVKLSTGPSGVGVTSSVGLAIALSDLYGSDSPFVHVIEGEGGLTPGRVSEACSAAASAGLDNLVLHVDWNESAIDSDRVTREGKALGDYVQWDPREYLLVLGFNVLFVKDGFDFNDIYAAQEMARSLRNQRPTAVVYRTVKGWRYGIEGKKSHGAGHAFCSEGYYSSVRPFEEEFGVTFPRFEGNKTPTSVERSYFESLLTLRRALSSRVEPTAYLSRLVAGRREALQSMGRKHRAGAPRIDAVLAGMDGRAERRPEACSYAFGSSQTLREALADALNVLNRESGGGVLAASADVYGSTNTFKIGAGFGEGFWHAKRNPSSRILAAGGIAEDAICGIASGISSIGGHIGVGTSYGAFIVPLGLIASRTHAIGQQMLSHRIPGAACRPFVLVAGHTGVKTGEDGPTHAEPDTLAMMQENYPRGTLITLTPWDPHDLWPLLAAGLAARPAVLAVFVTRPAEVVFDRASYGLAPPEASVKGVYRLLEAGGRRDAALVLQGSDVANVFVSEVLPVIRKRGLNLDVYYVASAELFDRIPAAEREAIYPEDTAREAIMMSGFSLPTIYRFVTSARGRELSLYPHKAGRYLGSGPGEICLEEAGLSAEAQLEAIERMVSSCKPGVRV